MFVDWARSKMAIIDPLTDETINVAVFVSCLLSSGIVFANGILDEKLSSWLSAHQDASAYFW